ncbi:DegQ family serine endoprotease [Pelagibius marinus]|uniref:DegQ family serine endoprotease n=1 Tax=Pelagibius marinus TaxID=2762760 RepID=UPI001872A20A|nr:DegQ family serine endoprotease [Pelagibius marinus]
MSQIAVAERPEGPGRPLQRPRRRWGAGLVAASVVASGLLWSGVAAAAQAPESFADLAKKVSPAVVNIASTQEVERPEGNMQSMPFDFPGSPFEDFFKQFRRQYDEHGRPQAAPRHATALGSGFIIDPAGYVVTNNHVVDHASEVTVRLTDESVYPAKVIGVDPQTDLALLKIDAGKPLPALSLGDSDEAEVGDWVMAVGNPFGLGGTVTAGIISARGRNIQAGPYDDFLQIDASINRGNSGGPLFDLDGNVIGVNTAIYSPNGGSVGIGFAIPSNMVKTVVAQLREKGTVERGWLGVQIQNVSPDLAEALGLDKAAGAIVAEVTPDSPAEKAGLKSGDVILSFAGEAIDDTRELARVVAQHPAKSEAEMKIWRNGEAETLTVVTGRQPGAQRLAEGGGDEAPDGSYHASALDAQLAALTPSRRAKYGLDENLQGVLVLDIKEGSIFQQSLRSGDVIKQVDGTAVTEPQQVERKVEAAKATDRKAVLMLVNRNGQDLFLGVKLGVA